MILKIGFYLPIYHCAGYFFTLKLFGGDCTFPKNVVNCSFTVVSTRGVQNSQARDFTEHHRATQNPSIRTFVYSIFCSLKMAVPYRKREGLEKEVLNCHKNAILPHIIIDIFRSKNRFIRDKAYRVGNMNPKLSRTPQ